MRVFYTICYYAIFCISMKVIAVKTLEFKKGKKWLCFFLQLLLEITPIFIMALHGCYEDGLNVLDLDYIYIPFYIADIALVAIFMKGNFIVNAIEEFFYCQMWYMFLLISCSVYVLMFTKDVKPVVACDTWSDIGNLVAYIIVSAIVVLIAISAWRVLLLTLRKRWLAVCVGILLMVPFAVNTLSQEGYGADNQYTLNKDNALKSLALFIGLVVFLIYLYYLYAKRSSKEQMAMLDQSLRSGYKQYSMLTEVATKNARWCHDIANHLSVIEKVSDQQHRKLTQPVVEYTKEILEQSRSVNVAGYTGNAVLDCVLSIKNNLAVENRIQTKMDVFFPQKADISDYELVGLVANLLDNAIEACIMVETEKRFLYLHSNAMTNYLCIELENSKSGTLQVQGHGLATTKEDKVHHGYGTQLIYEIVKKYEGEIRYVDEGDRLRTEIMFKIG